MKTNKTISIEISDLEEMLEYCREYKISFSGLIIELWTYFKTTYLKRKINE